MADGRTTQPRDARTDRRDAALVAQYIHELSERHGAEAGQATAPRAGAGTGRDGSGDA
jgi:hypothetical protein